MDRIYASGAAGSAPSVPASPSSGYPTAGNPGTGTPATKPGPYWYHMIMEELMAIITAAGITPEPGTLNQVKQALDSLYMVNSSALGKGYMLLADEKAQNTSGGSSIAGVQTRALNTVRANTIPGASLAANQVTLPAGTYRIRGSAPSMGSDQTRAYLYNVTDAATAILGTSEHGSAGAEALTTRSFIDGRITIASQKTFDLRQFTDRAVSTFGLGGLVNNGGNEVYSLLEITKEA